MTTWLYWFLVGLAGAIVFQLFFSPRENLTMLSENRVVDAWGNVTLTP